MNVYSHVICVSLLILRGDVSHPHLSWHVEGRSIGVEGIDMVETNLDYKGCGGEISAKEENSIHIDMCNGNERFPSAVEKGLESLGMIKIRKLKIYPRYYHARALLELKLIAPVNPVDQRLPGIILKCVAKPFHALHIEVLA